MRGKLLAKNPPIILRREIKHKPNCFNKLTTVIVRRTFISHDFSTYPQPMSILLAALVPPPEGGGELVGVDTSRDPFPLLLEAAVVQGDACQLVLLAPKQEEVRRREIR
jgi:hypothetical protein